jgi:16S rRNA (guanine527-N7)-methyltransferase
LIEWNKKINLTTITDKRAVYLKHFYDSLTLNLVCDLNKINNLCDIGSGAGFPGIVIKIFFPTIDMILVDSLNKRTKFLNTVITTLDLKKIKVVNERAEDFALNHRELFDVVVARAVVNLNILAELCIPLTKVRGIFIAMKGINNEEIERSKNGIKKLGGQIIDIKEFLLPIENSNRRLIKITKKTKTSPKYPRKFHEIKRNPL